MFNFYQTYHIVNLSRVNKFNFVLRLIFLNNELQQSLFLCPFLLVFIRHFHLYFIHYIFFFCLFKKLLSYFYIIWKVFFVLSKFLLNYSLLLILLCLVSLMLIYTLLIIIFILIQILIRLYKGICLFFINWCFHSEIIFLLLSRI